MRHYLALSKHFDNFFEIFDKYQESHNIKEPIYVLHSIFNGMGQDCVRRPSITEYIIDSGIFSIVYSKNFSHKYKFDTREERLSFLDDYLDKYIKIIKENKLQADYYVELDVQEWADMGMEPVFKCRERYIKEGIADKIIPVIHATDNDGTDHLLERFPPNVDSWIETWKYANKHSKFWAVGWEGPSADKKRPRDWTVKAIEESRKWAIDCRVHLLGCLDADANKRFDDSVSGDGITPLRDSMYQNYDVEQNPLFKELLILNGDSKIAKGYAQFSWVCSYLLWTKFFFNDLVNSSIIYGLKYQDYIPENILTAVKEKFPDYNIEFEKKSKNQKQITFCYCKDMYKYQGANRFLFIRDPEIKIGNREVPVENQTHIFYPDYSDYNIIGLIFDKFSFGSKPYCFKTKYTTTTIRLGHERFVELDRPNINFGQYTNQWWEGGKIQPKPKERDTAKEFRVHTQQNNIQWRLVNKQD